MAFGVLGFPLVVLAAIGNVPLAAVSVIYANVHFWTAVFTEKQAGQRVDFSVPVPVEAINNADEYAKVKEVLYKKYPFFDGNVLDAAKFLFGCDVSEVTWHEGWMSIMDDLSDGDLVMGAPEEDEEFDAPAHSGPILEGSRNKTLNHYAYRDLCFIVQTRIKAGWLVNGIRNIAEEIVLKELVYI